MNHLMRGKAPITDEAWAEIDAEARRSLTNYLAARKLVDFSGPHGWSYSALPTGRDVQAEHSALAEAALDRDAEKAVGLLTDHYLRTVADLAGVMRAAE